MVASAKHPPSQTRETFLLPFHLHIGPLSRPMEIWLPPSCSSRDSASDEISVIDIFKKWQTMWQIRSLFCQKSRPVYRFITSEILYI